MGLPAEPACCLGVAYSANYRKGKLTKYRERKGIDVISPPLLPHYGRDRIDGHNTIYLAKLKRKLTHDFLCILGS